MRPLERSMVTDAPSRCITRVAVAGGMLLGASGGQWRGWHRNMALLRQEYSMVLDTGGNRDALGCIAGASRCPLLCAPHHSSSVLICVVPKRTVF